MAQWFAYNERSILKNVPATSGVYALHSQMGCVYVGGAEDIRSNLLVHVRDDNPCLDLQDPIYFTFDLVAPEARETRQTELARKLHPACLRREDYPECQGCSLTRKRTKDN
jgi:hypothetical protein